MMMAYSQGHGYLIVAYFLKARTVEPEKQSLLGNSCVTCNNEVTAGSVVFCAVRAGGIYQGVGAITKWQLEE
jgi:hypothetical protein